MGEPTVPKRQDGYSIVELLVAVTVFALVFAAVSIGIGRALEVNRGNRNRSAAAYLAARQLEDVRAKAFTSLALGQTTCVYSAPTTGCNVPSPYTVVQNVVWASPGNTSTSCDVPATSGSALAYKRVTVTVTWPDMGGVAPVTSQTLLTPPAGTYDPNDGHILVQAYDRGAVPLAGQTVSLTGPETASQTTTSDGCAFFAYLDPGTYPATISTTGYVDRQRNQPATQTVGVTASQISRVQFDYDRAATLSVTLVAPSGAVIPTVTPGIAMTVANSNLTVGYKSFQQSATGSGTTRTITPLFPYASGYQVWAGDCADADPAAYTGGSRGAVLASNPGATTSGGSAALDAVDVTVRRTSVTGTLQAGATVSAIHAAGTGCTAGETLTTTTTTDSLGKLRLALPYGTWTIRAVNGSRTGTATVTLDPVSTAVPALTVVIT
ncbi:MAG TPA: prepilin-type N-terminal cleavage/methylation domain-containing protein [Actinomycetes bacterium]|nr:prepilin-type N-terminal cleavage/methylation domain-containing protein [Actinomycetes bacterium]